MMVERVEHLCLDRDKKKKVATPTCPQWTNSRASPAPPSLSTHTCPLINAQIIPHGHQLGHVRFPSFPFFLYFCSCAKGASKKKHYLHAHTSHAHASFHCFPLAAVVQLNKKPLSTNRHCMQPHHQTKTPLSIDHFAPSPSKSLYNEPHTPFLPRPAFSHPYPLLFHNPTQTTASQSLAHPIMKSTTFLTSTPPRKDSFSDDEFIQHVEEEPYFPDAAFLRAMAAMSSKSSAGSAPISPSSQPIRKQSNASPAGTSTDQPTLRRTYALAEPEFRQAARKFAASNSQSKSSTADADLRSSSRGRDGRKRKKAGKHDAR